jgi:4-amino-4-deoxy-L-arabinose transferase-like glycosyltransferase
MRKSVRSELLFLVAVVIVAMLVRAAFTALPRVVRWDEAAYQLIARSLLSGLGYSELSGARDLQQPPVVAYLSAAGRLLHLPIPWSTAALAHVLLGGLLPIPVYLLARDLKSRRIAAIAALLVALHPALAVSPLYWSTMTEPPYVLFILCGTYAGWRTAVTGGWRWPIAMGAAFGLAYLTRPEALAYLLALLAFVLLYRGRAALRQAGVLRLAGRLAVAAVLFFVVCTPYVVYVHRVTGRWELSGKQGITMGIAWAYAQGSQAEHDRVTASLDPSGKEIEWLSTEQYDFSLLGWIREDPGRFVSLLRHNARTFFAALFQGDLFQPWQIVLIALGLFTVPWPRRRAVREAFLFCALAPTLALIGVFVLGRFLAVVVPFGMIWAGEGIEVLLGWTTETVGLLSQEGRSVVGKLFAAGASLILPGIALLLLVECCSVAVHERGAQPFYRVEAAAWLAQHAPPASPVMVRDSEIPLYAGLPQVAFPNASWDKVTAYARDRGARYVVIDDKEIRTIRPALAPLLDPEAAEPLPGLTPLARLAAGGRTTLIFALR